MVKNLFQILKILEKDSNFTQRKLSGTLGISLGTINYCMKKLIEKGLIKTNNFRNHNNKIQYSYLLTPKGVEEKARLTLKFIKIKTEEYNALEEEIRALKKDATNEKIQDWMLWNIILTFYVLILQKV